MLRYPIIIIYTQQMLTALDGDPVGTSVGFRGAFEGDRLGLEVGCKIDVA